MAAENYTWQQVIRDTDLMFDASNLSGLAHSFPGICRAIREHEPNREGGYNQHPLMILWLDKMCQLAGFYPASPAPWNRAYDWFKEEQRLVKDAALDAAIAYVKQDRIELGLDNA